MGVFCKLMHCYATTAAISRPDANDRRIINMEHVVLQCNTCGPSRCLERSLAESEIRSDAIRNHTAGLYSKRVNVVVSLYSRSLFAFFLRTFFSFTSRCLSSSFSDASTRFLFPRMESRQTTTSAGDPLQQIPASVAVPLVATWLAR